jgi:hypothetical protein
MWKACPTCENRIKRKDETWCMIFHAPTKTLKFPGSICRRWEEAHVFKKLRNGGY